ncbi:MAG: class II aldolase/adducin family protein [Gammaproteobacteria bacterium]|nr:class II aldolase/adducin family protein [Gammaproteobacteria bacterium]
MCTKEKLVEYYSWLRKYGYNDSHSGNASFRDQNTIWVTPSGACADTLQAKDLVACSMEGLTGENASFDARLHVEVYKQNPSARALLHSHGPHSIAVTMNGKDFAPEDFEGKLYFPKVPVLNIPFAEYSEKSPDLIARILREHCITVTRGHGVYACGKSLDLAYKWTCSLEHSAKISCLGRQINSNNHVSSTISKSSFTAPH